MRRISLAVALAILAVLGLVVYWLLPRNTIVLSADDLQRELDRRFPIERNEPMLSVRFFDPRVTLDERTSRVGMGITTSASAMGLKTVSGRTDVEGTVRYDQETGELYLADPTVVRLNISGLGEREKRVAEEILKGVLSEYLRGAPIYELRERDRTRFKSAVVEHGRLVVRLAP